MGHITDRRWAEWIAWTLEDAGFRILIRAWDFTPGSHWIAGMDEGIQRSARTIAVLSEEYSRSAYVRAEWQLAWAADPKGAARKLLVIRVENCERPGLLAQVVPIDLFGLSEERARTVLLEAAELAVSGGRAKPRTAPSYPRETKAVPVRPSFPEPRSAESMPSTLLRPEYAIVPFVDLHGDRATLRSWVTRPEACSARLLTGEAGSGKTRLAMQVCEDMAEQGWLTVLTSSLLNPTQLHHIGQAAAPVLVVVDNAELRPDQVTAIATTLTVRAASGGSPSRLLLLTRSAECWLRDLRQLPDVRIADLFLRAETQPTTVLLAGPHSRHIHFNAAYAAFRVELQQAGAPVVPPPHLVDCQSVLDVHAAALNAAVTGTRISQSSQAPLVTLDRHDQQRWHELGRAEDGNLRVGLAAKIRTLATLLQPGSADEAEALLAMLPSLLGVDAERVQDCEDTLGRLYSGRWTFDPIRPDAYGEHLAAATLTAEPSIVLAVASSCTTTQIATVLTVLGCMQPRHPEMAAMIAALIRHDPDRILFIAIDVVTRLPDPELFARTASDAVADSSLAPSTVIKLGDRVLPERGGPELAPLRGLYVRATGAIPKQIFPDAYQDIAQDANLARFKNTVDSIAGVVTDAFIGLIDSNSGRMPSNPDGTDLIPPKAVETLRAIFQSRSYRNPNG